ncbi:MAG: hypothetical protein ACFB5Z_11020 [Elainellaceae cyanobacterium]
MSQGFKGLRIDGLPRISNWLVLIGIVWLLGSVGLGWLVKSVVILIGLLLIAPIIGFWALRWWLKRNLVEAPCPVCGSALVGLNGQEIRCPSCREPVKADDKLFQRLTPPGTVDIDAVEVQSQEILE